MIVYCPVLLMRNLDPPGGLCNGTRLIVTKLLPTIIEATIATGTAIGKRTYIPRITFIYNNPDLPFTFSHKQFPLKVCYAMTINKSQGQSLSKVGIYLPQPVFSHGQLYVALSRATSPNAVKVLIVDENGKYCSETKNVVYTKLINEINKLQVKTMYYTIYYTVIYNTLQLLFHLFVIKLCFRKTFTIMTRISELTYGCVGDVLEVRLLRKWYRTSKSKETWFLGVDKHGDCIQILGNKTSQKFIESRFQLNKCYSIDDYTCATTDKYKKMVQNPIYINVGRASTICDIEDKEEIPKHWFSFASFSYLLTLSRSPNNEFPDVIGYCKGLRHLFKQNDTQEPFVKLDLCDESLSLSATIADDSNSIPIIFSDDAIQTLCGSKCEHLVCELGYINRSELPPLFNTFIDKDLSFYLQLTRRAINVGENHFVATNIITDIPSQDVSIVSPTDAPPITPVDKSGHVSSSSTITASSPTSNTRKRLQFGNMCPIQ
ncbi:hypothetical protein LXL04_000902 [Taraxacum kok-saghyz]